jgi:hypothetical protein
MAKKTTKKTGGQQGKKSASPKIDYSNPADVKRVKKKLLQDYLNLKKKSGDHEKELTRMFFVQNTDSNNHQIERIYGTWQNLKDEAEEAYRKKLPQKIRALLSERTKKIDASATEDDCIEDIRALQEENFGHYITRNFYREHGKYSDSTWNQFFGTFQQFRRKAGLELTRQQHAIERAIAKHSSVDHYRDFYRSEVLPYFDKYTKRGSPFHLKKILAMSDLHDQECDRFSLSVFIDTCERMQPDVIVLNGDIYDLLEFGKYSVDPRHYDIKGRFDFVKHQVFKPLREKCPDAQIDLIAGNHEMRLLKLLADKTPNVRILLSDVMGLGFADVFGLDEFEINWASKFDLAAYSNKDMNDEIKKNYRIYFESFVFSHKPDNRLRNSLSGSNGHHHQGIITPNNVVDPLTNIARRLTWSQTPAMHVPDAEYLENVSGWNTGFLEVTVNIRTKEAIQKIHQTHSDWAEINGVYYEREESEDEDEI